ncbi:hypothetical protein PVL29_013241 [Vitis rotundifolia]|uniref:Uncharacterized protein n=1 Tax=Vitis rotundifolia TaxID=103349 RepID=A0AA39DN90_VITRO|nr:hypothetical protein PVL29_013241 [Vitis rotundifolia]
MKKTFYYNFFPTKAEEEEAAKSGSSDLNLPVKRELIEIRDFYPPPEADPANPWKIKKIVNNTDVLTGKLVLLQNDVFEHIFRYWSLDICNQVVKGNKVYTAVWDLTPESNPIQYQNENTYFGKGPRDTYILGWLDVVRNAKVKSRDEVGLYWDQKTGTFHLKILRRGV